MLATRTHALVDAKTKLLCFIQDMQTCVTEKKKNCVKCTRGKVNQPQLGNRLTLFVPAQQHAVAPPAQGCTAAHGYFTVKSVTNT